MDDKDILSSSIDDKIEPITQKELDQYLGNYSINIDDTILTSSMASSTYNYSPSHYGNITITNGATGSTLSNNFNGSFYTTSPPSGLHVSGTAEFEGDVKIKGVSILETLEKIEKRLCILKPDPEKLEHFEALKKAYEHYKTLEALCEIPKEEKE